MSEVAKRQIRRVLSNALAFIGSKVVSKAITSQSTSQLLDEQVKLIEGESGPGSGSLTAPQGPKRPGQIAKVQKIQGDIGQLTDSIIADPSILDSDRGVGKGIESNLDGISIDRA